MNSMKTPRFVKRLLERFLEIERIISEAKTLLKQDKVSRIKQNADSNMA